MGQDLPVNKGTKKSFFFLSFLLMLLLSTLQAKPLDGEKCGPKLWNQKAWDLYQSHAYADAIRAIKSSPGCYSRDNQMVFQSYMLLYLDRPSKVLKSQALRDVLNFTKTPIWFDDPGPLLVTLGEDKRAISWYKMALSHERNSPGNVSGRHDFHVREIYYQSAIELISAPSWNSLGTKERVRQIFDTQRKAGKLEKGPKEPAASSAASSAVAK